MSGVGSIFKQPFENLDYNLDFVERLEEAETISLTGGGVTSINVLTGEDSTDAIIGADAQAPAISGSKVIFWVKAGANDEQHKITVRITTSGARKLEEDLDLVVVER